MGSCWQTEFTPTRLLQITFLLLIEILRQLAHFVGIDIELAFVVVQTPDFYFVAKCVEHNIVL